jgi:hypothetical protein
MIGISLIDTMASVVPIIGKDAVTAAFKKLVDRYLEAQQGYSVTASISGAETPLEEARTNLISRICLLQSEVMFNVVEPSLLIKMAPPLIEYATEVYLATTATQLSMIEVNLNQIDSILNRYKKVMASRRNARRLAVFLTVLSFVGLACLAIFNQGIGVSSDTMISVLDIPLPVVLWSFVGSLTAMLYRFNKTSDVEMADPLRWLFTRPVTGVVMGVVAYLVLKVGLVSLGSSIDVQKLGMHEFMWLFSFIVGFSDRYCDAILRSLVGRFGGDAKDDLVSLDATQATITIPSITDLLAKLRGKLGESSDRHSPDEAIPAAVFSRFGADATTDDTVRSPSALSTEPPKKSTHVLPIEPAPSETGNGLRKPKKPIAEKNHSTSPTKNSDFE